jgi:hypothetical protein
VQEFFTDPGAEAQQKDFLRFLVARWGYSPHIAALEIFNEIDNTMYDGKRQDIPDGIITAWHAEMSGYLKSIDPYHHLLTTSISHRQVAGLYNIAAMDFNQIHIYGHKGQSNIPSFPEVLRHNSQLYGKPYVIGEFACEWDWLENFDDHAANMDDDYKKGLWLGLFSPTPILPMSWWWEYFDHRNMTPYIARVRSVLDQMLAAAGGAFADADCKWEGPSAKVMAVRCGKTYFVLLINNGTAPVTGSLSLPLDAAQNYQVRAYDPQRNVTNTLASLPAGITRVPGVSIASDDECILILTP